MADDHPPPAAVRAQADALARQTGEWTVVLPDSDPGTLDTAGHLRGDEVPELYSRTVALTAQRVRMLSAELARDIKLRGRAALVREDMLWDPEEGRPVVAREVPSGLAVLEGRERDR
ncbi:MAG: hypothetical protein ACRDTZ_10130, partial [Pseudonocardiaceae bacterium]